MLSARASGEAPGVEAPTATDTLTPERVLVDAFHDDPFIRWLFPEDQAFTTGFPRILSAYFDAADKGGALEVDRSGAAAMLSLAPGAKPAFLPIAAAVLPRVNPGRLPQLLWLFHLMEQRRPKEAHWYVAFAGVSAAERGRGLGSAVARQGLSRQERDGMPIYLEATGEGSARFWARHGFAALAPISTGGAELLFPMIRPAA